MFGALRPEHTLEPTAELSGILEHRLGFVPAEEPSILIRGRSKHSAESFDLCRWYLKEVKTRVPIWKRPIFAEN